MAEKLPKFEPAAQYRIKLDRMARHGTSILRPKDAHIVSGAAAAEIVPQEAIVSAEKV